MSKTPVNQTPSVPGRNIVDGDIVYFRHEKHGPLSGRVVCAGRDGATIEHETGENGLHRVAWDNILGHKQRKVRKLTLLERGEDGGIATDEKGNRVFIAGEIPGEEEDLAKSDADYQPLTYRPILIDIGNLHGASCDCALESMHKALSDEDGIAHDIWAEHESPFIRGLIEKFTERGLTKLSRVQAELGLWMTGDHYVPAKQVIPVPPGFMGRWTQEELDLVRIYLENIPPGQMTMDDWAMTIDYMVQRYLPPETLNEEAEWLAVKSNLMGRVQAHVGDIDPSIASALAEALPSTVADAGIMFKFSDVSGAILAYGKERACDAVQAISEATRHKLKRVVLDYEQKRLAGDPVTTSDLQSKLLDEFGSLNRDWRRIAVTEAGEMANQGVVSSLPKDAEVRRLEMYNGACPFCKKLDGRVYRVTTASDPDKDGAKDVWPGKTNIGRSSSPRKRVGNELVDRTPEERWWCASGTQHPHCRGRWEPIQSTQPGDDPEFAAWLRKHLGQTMGMAE